MREKLKEIHRTRTRFSGVFVRFGEKNGYQGRTIRTVLLKDITSGGEVMCDHVWFVCGKQLAALDLKEGDEIDFNARVTAYTKGYKGRREDVYKPLERDYRLSFPTKFRKREKEPTAQPGLLAVHLPEDVGEERVGDGVGGC